MSNLTVEMRRYFEARTRAHIALVGRCLCILGKGHPDEAELQARARVHDESKFGPEERVPYIWLTEYHRCRAGGIPFSYPPGIEEVVERAIVHHKKNNRHHPEFHANVNDMAEVDLIEMVCDWKAMAIEKNSSVMEFAARVIGRKYPFSPESSKMISDCIRSLEGAL